MPFAIASKSMSISTPYPGRAGTSAFAVTRGMRGKVRTPVGGSAAGELGVPRAAVLEEGPHRVPQILGREQLRPLGPHHLVGRRDAAFAEAPQDPLGHRVGLGRAGGELIGERPRERLELLLRVDLVDDAPALQ